MSRLLWLDRAKGFGICLVAFGHVMRGMVGAGIVASDPLSQGVDYTLYSFHMPLFFLLSGLNAERSLRHGPQAFLASKLQFILWPYFLWSIIEGLIQIHFAASVNAPIGYGDLLTVGWKPFGQFWFLYDLFGCHLILLACGGRRRLLGGVAIASLALSAWAQLDYAKFLFNFFFYAAGIFVTAPLAAWSPTRRELWRLLGLAAGLFALAATVCLHAKVSLNHPFAAPAAILGVAGSIVLCKLLDGAVGRLFEVIGNMSMTIFILHILAGAGARIGLQKLGVPPEPLLYIVCATFVSIAAPMLAHVVFERLGLLPWLGVSARRRVSPAATQAVASAQAS